MPTAGARIPLLSEPARSGARAARRSCRRHHQPLSAARRQLDDGCRRRRRSAAAARTGADGGLSHRRRGLLQGDGHFGAHRPRFHVDRQHRFDGEARRDRQRDGRQDAPPFGESGRQSRQARRATARCSRSSASFATCTTRRSASAPRPQIFLGAAGAAEHASNRRLLRRRVGADPGRRAPRRRSIDKTVPMFDVQTIGEVLDKASVGDRFTMLLLVGLLVPRAACSRRSARTA